jgi:cyanophycin synthetase
MASEIALDAAAGWRATALAPPLAEIVARTLAELRLDLSNADAAELIAALAQHWQCQAGATPIQWGVAARDAERHTASLYFGCTDPSLGRTALMLAMRAVDRLIAPQLSPSELVSLLEEASKAAGAAGLDQSTLAMIATAERRGIPWFRVTGLSRHVQFGQGERQRRIRETLLDNEGAIGREISRNKLLSLSVLAQIRLPVGKLAAVKDVKGALQAAEVIGYPLVLKPIFGLKGRSVRADLRTPTDLRQAAVAARIDSQPFMLQSFFPGADHRLLVIGGKLIAAARRTGASVIGDGHHSVLELVAIENRNPMRGAGFTKLMNQILLDEDSDRLLDAQCLTRASIPERNRTVRLKSAANISAGGTSVDVTDRIHPDNARVAERAAKALGVSVAGIDFICPDISRSWREVGGGICEVNLIVGLRAHLLANPNRDVTGPILDLLYPPGEDGRIPTAMITGTVGKTTTTSMLASILAAAGHVVGSVTTEGVSVGGEVVATGDYAGANGAEIVLRDPTVTAAALETARGGLLKSGIYLDRCDVAALLNIGREQVEMDGITSIDELAGLKRKVLETATKAVVLNADDARCAALIPEFAACLRTILVSRNPDCALIAHHRNAGGEVLYLSGVGAAETIMLAQGGDARALVGTAELPSTMGGLIWQNAANAVAAAALAFGLGIAPETIAEGLKRYGAEFRAVGRRFAFADGLPLQVMFDFAAHAPALSAAVTVTDAVPVVGRRLCAVCLPGNRPDWQYAECAAAIAEHFDDYVCYECDHLRRGREPGAIAAALAQALIAAGADRRRVWTASTPREGAAILAREARADDFAVIFGAVEDSIVDDYHTALAQTFQVTS